MKYKCTGINDNIDDYHIDICREYKYVTVFNRHVKECHLCENKEFIDHVHHDLESCITDKFKNPQLSDLQTDGYRIDYRYRANPF
jgi:hypothetical protein